MFKTELKPNGYIKNTDSLGQVNSLSKVYSKLQSNVENK